MNVDLDKIALELGRSHVARIMLEQRALELEAENEALRARVKELEEQSSVSARTL